MTETATTATIATTRFGTRTRTMNNEGIDDENEDEDDG